MATSSAVGTRGFWWRLALIVGAAAVLRILYTVLVAPWPPHSLTDEFYYSNVSQLVAQGRGFINPAAVFGAAHPAATAAHPPLYVLVLAGLAKLGGTGATAQRLTGTVFGCATVLLVSLLGRRVATERVGLIAAGLAAVYPILITADGALMSESLFGMLIAASLLAAYRLYEHPTAGRGVALGALIGLAALTRDEALFLGLLILVPLLRRPRGLTAASAAVVACLVVLSPWMVRNWSAFDRFVPLSTGAGAAIGGANCPTTYYGAQIGGWNGSCLKPHPGNEAAQADAQVSDGLHYAEHHLSRVPVVVLARLGRVWSLYAPRVAPEGRLAGVQLAGLAMYYLMIPLAIGGLILLRRAGKQTWLLITPFILTCAVAIFSYGNIRFREPAELALVVLSAIAVDHLSRSVPWLAGFTEPALQRGSA